MLTLGSLPGCAEEDALTARLELNDAGECAAEQLARIRTLSVSVYGKDEDDAACLLNRACASPTATLESIDDVAQVLRDEDQPVIDDAAFDAAVFVAILGHDSLSCGFFADPDDEGDEVPTLCGFIDVSQLDDGHGQITVTCEACEPTPVKRCR